EKDSVPARIAQQVGPNAHIGVRTEIDAARVVDVPRGIGAVLLGGGKHIRSGGEDESQRNSGLDEHGDLLVGCHPHQLGVCSHLVVGCASGKSACCLARSIPWVSDTAQKDVVGHALLV